MSRVSASWQGIQELAPHLKHTLVSGKAEARAASEETLHAVRQVALLHAFYLTGLLLWQSGLSRQACSACTPSQRAAGSCHTTCNVMCLQYSKVAVFQQP